MHIAFVEIQNFRKLKSVRIDFSRDTTLFVGANNSGKTSATLALRYFLAETEEFSTNDFTLSNWDGIEKIALAWESADAKSDAPTLKNWERLLPALDVWVEASLDEVRYVRPIVPTLDWSGGLLGVRLRLEPKKVVDLYKDYTAQRTLAVETAKSGNSKVKLWPESMSDYLERRLSQQFTVRTYLLDASACKDPVNGIASPQALPPDIGPVDGSPLNSLIRVDAISAQRGFRSSSTSTTRDGDEPTAQEGGLPLTAQLRSYYRRHLDPAMAPESDDLAALEAVEKSQETFDKRLAAGFKAPLAELAELNYPGVADPRLTIATQLRPIDAIQHNAAVQYDLNAHDPEAPPKGRRLPEGCNGLGYQHLISIVFRLMAFRDGWMRVGKAGKVTTGTPGQLLTVPPLHLVIVEEPEAHLHPQVQQVFVLKAYDVLRNNAALGIKTDFRTQLVVSTHSSHVAHETNFSSLRYFRRLGAAKGEVPFSAVVNLTRVFGENTEKFVARYIRATHCDLLFADAAILVEGDAERILVPHFIRKRFTKLPRCYVTLMQVGGSHAHRLEELVRHLGLITLIVTDVDTGEPTGRHKYVAPERGAKLVCNNPTLKEWHPKRKTYDELIGLSAAEKIRTYTDEQFAVRVAYQMPVKTKLKADGAEFEALPATFEDALIFENIEVFRGLSGEKLLTSVQDILAGTGGDPEKAKEISEAVRKPNVKAEFALDLLLKEETLGKLKGPAYIDEGLDWLEQQLVGHQSLVLSKPAKAPAEPAPAGS